MAKYRMRKASDGTWRVSGRIGRRDGRNEVVSFQATSKEDIRRRMHDVAIWADLHRAVDSRVNPEPQYLTEEDE